MVAWEVQRGVESLARRQHGVFTRRQALELGASSGVISRQVRNRRWIRLAPSVYAVAAVPATWLRTCKAAQLSAADSLVSHGAAAVLHEMPGFRPGGIHLTVGPTGNARNRLARTHRAEVMPPSTVVQGFRVVTIEHTLVTMAGRSSFGQLEGALDALLLAHRTTVAAVTDRQDALASGHPRNAARLSALLAERKADAPTHESDLERLLSRVLAGSGSPPVVRQSPFPWQAGGRERVDAFIPEWGLIVEADGRNWHGRLADFERDRIRDNEAVAHGYRVQRFTWAHLVADPADARRQLAAAGTWKVRAA